MPQPYTSFVEQIGQTSGVSYPPTAPKFVGDGGKTYLGPALGTGRPVGLQTQPYLGSIALPDGFVGTAYDAEGDQAAPEIATPITYSISSGSLPPGLSLSTSGTAWVISGTPTTAGTYTFTLEATNSYGSSTANLSIVIHAPSSGSGGSFVFG